MDQSEAFTDGTLLGGRVSYRQPVQGYRTGIEPVVLAAAVPARSNDKVLEAGTGAGAGLLALCARVPNLSGVGLERDPAMARLAAANLTANRIASARILCADIEAWEPDTVYDHAFANPPWHGATSTPSPDAGRRDAKVAGDDTLEIWIAILAASLRHRGSVTLILPAALFGRAAQAFTAAHCPEIALKPLGPHENAPAKLVIMQAVKNGKGASRVLPGLCLHQPDGGYTAAADRILRDGAPLDL